jgi:hypothetical protein
VLWIRLVLDQSRPHNLATERTAMEGIWSWRVGTWEKDVRRYSRIVTASVVRKEVSRHNQWPLAIYVWRR